MALHVPRRRLAMLVVPVVLATIDEFIEEVKAALSDDGKVDAEDWKRVGREVGARVAEVVADELTRANQARTRKQARATAASAPARRAKAKARVIENADPIGTVEG